MDDFIVINDKLSWKFMDSGVPYVRCRMYDRHGKIVDVDYNAYLFGLIGMMRYKKINKEHSLILVTGKVGAGKSSLVEGIAALDAAFNGQQLTINDIGWSMDKLIELMDSTDNIERPIWADEFIQGSSRFNQTNIGIKLKIGFVTKRFKRNTYYLVLDEINEFPEKVIKMADAYINVRKIGFQRGYYDCWTTPYKIYQLWNLFKNYKINWGAQLIKEISPDNKGKFQNYQGIFIDNKEFDKTKFEETKQNKDTTYDRRMQALSKAVIKLKEQGLSYQKIGDIIGYGREQVRRFILKGKSEK